MILRRRASARTGRVRGQAMVPVIVALSVAAATASLLPPTLSAWRTRTDKERSLRNVYLLAQATRLYAQDWNGRLPGWVRNPDGNYAHNTWDQQVRLYVPSDAVFSNGLPGQSGILSPSDPCKERVLTYGINGLLIVPSNTLFTGSMMTGLNMVHAANPPVPARLETLPRPEDTILFAELATDSVYGPPWNSIRPRPYTGDTSATGSPRWQAAKVAWIDISPRELVENYQGGNYWDSYDPDWTVGWGVARSLYGGGGNYSFVDGHAEFLKLADSVGLGKTFLWGTTPVVAQPNTGGAWSHYNHYNRWNPYTSAPPPPVRPRRW